MFLSFDDLISPVHRTFQAAPLTSLKPEVLNELTTQLYVWVESLILKPRKEFGFRSS